MRRAAERGPWAWVVLAALSGCAQFGLQPHPAPVRREAASTASGLQFQDLFVGQGPAARLGDLVTFEYTVWLEDGTRVDSTYDRGVAITVELGAAPIRVWDEGLVGIQPNGRRRLVAPPTLAYGSTGVEGLIPPDATLVFEVHALDIARAETGGQR